MKNISRGFRSIELPFRKAVFGTACLCLVTASAFADPVILFDDLNAPSNTTATLPQSYHGLHWNGLNVLDGVHFSVSPSGYQAGVVSKNNVIYPVEGNYQTGFNGAIQGGLFDLRSAYVTAVLYDNLSFEAKGLIHGTVVYDTTNILSATTPALIQFNFYGVDEVDFSTSGGGDHPGYPLGFDPGFAMDNVSVNVYVPYTQLVQNGGFESGSFTNWSEAGDISHNSIVTNSAYVNSGTYGARCGPSGAFGTLSQTMMPTFAGETYLISMALANPTAGIPNEFKVSLSGETVADLTNLTAFPMQTLQLSGTTFSPRATLQIGLRNDPGFFGLDDVSVTLLPIVQNGGFETGDLTGWIRSGNTNSQDVFTTTNYARSGTYGAGLGSSGSLGFISQSLRTFPGQAYLVSFWLNRPAAGASATNEFRASWNGQVLFDQTNLPAAGWTNLHFTVVASNTQSLLAFGERNDPDFFALDEVSVQPIPLVTNGGFETGDFSGWTQSGDTSDTFASSNASYKSSGYYGAQAGPFNSRGFISQTLNTVPGQTYLLSCWYGNPTGQTPNDFQILWNNGVILDLSNWGKTNFLNPQILVTASSTNTSLQFGVEDSPSFLALDEITVQPFPAPVIESITATNGSVVFNWSSVINFKYQPQVSTDLHTWTNLGVDSYATGGSMSTTNSVGANPHQYYRVLLEQPIFLF